LNWRNPEVKKAMMDAMRFWYKRGVAGFRLDAVDTLLEDLDLKDNPPLPGVDKFGFPNTNEIYNKKLPEVHEVMREMRKVADEYGAVLIGETWTQSVAQLREYYGERNDELQMPMDLMMTEFKQLSAPLFRGHINAVEDAGGWPVFVISNHDIVRSYTRWGDGVHNDDIAKVMAAMYLTLRGTPILYYGEEIGMENNDPKSKDDVRDPIGRRGWPLEKGRDGERTPMQWSDAVNAGFTAGTPWLPVAPNYKTHNVASETTDPNSILNFYRRLLQLRRDQPALGDGKYVALSPQDPNVFAFLRSFNGEAVLVVLNMSGESHTVPLDLAKAGFPSAKVRVLLTSSSRPEPAVSKKLSIGPFSAFIAKVSRSGNQESSIPVARRGR
jgi:alpha-glucosidase